MKVLVVEDYEPIRNAVARAIKEQNGVVTAMSNGLDGLWYAQNHELDVIILDVMLPDISGLEILSKLRQGGSSVPILMLTARDTLEDRVAGLDLGADDYLVKPFFMGELLSRLRALTRRKGDMKDEVVVIGDLEIDFLARRVILAGSEIELSAREYNLLEFLAKRKGLITTRSEIMDNVYDGHDNVASNVVDVYIGYLRKKLHQPGGRSYVHTKRGIGYYLEEGDWL